MRAAAHSKLRSKTISFYRLSKPGIVYGNLLTAGSGYLLASRWHINAPLLSALLAGDSLIIASACILNNYIDRHIDARMVRTQKRALITGEVSVFGALALALILGLAGFICLARTNTLTLIIGAVAFLIYVAIYGIGKRRSPYGTLIGTVPGASSLVAGYTAVTGRLDLTALILFLIMFTWQMPHFYTIAIRRLDDYSAAGLPVWPAAKGVESARRQIILFIILFIIASSLMSVFGGSGIIYTVLILIIGLRWLQLALSNFTPDSSVKWAKNTFLFSLVTLLALSILLPLGIVLK